MSQPAVLFGGPSPEHDVSVVLGLMAVRTLADAGRDPLPIYWSKANEWHQVEVGLEPPDFIEGVPRKAQPLRLQLGAGGGIVPSGGGLGRRPRPLDISAVLNCCHGGPGEDGTLQGALDLAGVRYSGPSVVGAALGMDKLAFAAAVGAAGVPHLPVATIDPADSGPQPFDGPYIVKPRFGGSSIGIEVVADWESTVAFVRSPQPLLRAGAVIEPYLEGAYDLNIAVRTWPELSLSAIERPLKSSGSDGILDYRDKYVGTEGMSSAPRELPAQISAEWEETIREAARVVARIVLVRGVARIDFLAVGDDLYVNEINTIPGSLAKHLFVDPPVPFLTLLDDLLAEATSGLGRPYPTTGADGTVLRAAGSIASKLG